MPVRLSLELRGTLLSFGAIRARAPQLAHDEILKVGKIWFRDCRLEAFLKTPQ
jgi:hypothetical protein